MAPNERNNEMEIGPDYIRVQTIQPHWGRKKDILKAHPEVKSLYGPDSKTAFHVLAVIAITTWLAWMVSQASLLTVFVVAYCVGSVFANIQWVFVHELTHDLVFRSPALNTLFLLLTNMSNIIPAAISFRYHHKTHHAHLNESYSDPDLPSEIEDSIFGHSMLGKATWLSSFAVVQSLRTLRSPQPFEWALPINYLLNGLYSYLVWTYIGPQAFGFLLLSSLLAVGFLLHPFGGRWLAEHWAVHRTPQETYSYYGPLNKVSYNIGHHQEHHDFTGISWSHLPKLRKIAPEFYETLHFHPSYVKLIWEYITNCNFTLKSRVVRWPKYHVDEKQE